MPSLMNLSGMGSTLFNKMAFWASMGDIPRQPCRNPSAGGLYCYQASPGPALGGMDNPSAMPATPQPKPVKAARVGCSRLTGTLGTWQCGWASHQGRAGFVMPHASSAGFPPGSHIQNRGGVTQPSPPSLRSQGPSHQVQRSTKRICTTTSKHKQAATHQAPGDS